MERSVSHPFVSEMTDNNRASSVHMSMHTRAACEKAPGEAPNCAL